MASLRYIAIHLRFYSSLSKPIIANTSFSAWIESRFSQIESGIADASWTIEHQLLPKIPQISLSFSLDVGNRIDEMRATSV